MASQEQPSQLLIVRNTFIEVAEPPPMQSLHRASTMPAQTKDGKDSESDSDSENEESQSPDDAQHLAEAHGATLPKISTCDGYEPTQEWDWTKSEMLPEAPPEAEWIVKNTFLEFGPSTDQLVVPSLIRHSSAPVTRQNDFKVKEEKAQKSLGVASEAPACEDTTCQAGPSSAGYNAPSLHAFGAGLPPQAPQLERVTTVNDYDYNPDVLPANAISMQTDIPPQAPKLERIMTVNDYDYNPDVLPANPISMQTNIPMPMDLPATYVPATEGLEGQAMSMVMFPVTYVMQEGLQGQSIMVPVARCGAFPETPASQPGPSGPPVPTEQTDPFAKLDHDKPPIDKPPLLQRHRSVSTQLFRFRWNLEESLLRKSDREKVSPPLELDVGGITCSFKMVVKPKEVSDGRGGRSFKKAKGKGTIEVLCADQRGISMKFVVAVGKSGASSFTEQSMPIEHDFENKHICSIPNEFDFQAAVDETLQQFCVSLQVMAEPVL